MRRRGLNHEFPDLNYGCAEVDEQAVALASFILVSHEDTKTRRFVDLELIKSLPLLRGFVPSCEFPDSREIEDPQYSPSARSAAIHADQALPRESLHTALPLSQARNKIPHVPLVPNSKGLQIACSKAHAHQ